MFDPSNLNRSISTIDLHLIGILLSIRLHRVLILWQWKFGTKYDFATPEEINRESSTSGIAVSNNTIGLLNKLPHDYKDVKNDQSYIL